MEQIKEKNGSGSYDLDADMRIRLNNMETVYYTGKNSNEIFEKIDKINKVNSLTSSKPPLTYSTDGSYNPYIQLISIGSVWDWNIGAFNTSTWFFDPGSKFLFNFTTGDYFFTDSVGFHHGGLMSENLALVLERVTHDNRDGLSEVIRSYQKISERGTPLTRDEFTSVLNTIHTYAQDNYYHRSTPRVSDSIAVVNEIERTIFSRMVRMESPDSDGN